MDGLQDSPCGESVPFSPFSEYCHLIITVQFHHIYIMYISFHCQAATFKLIDIRTRNGKVSQCVNPCTSLLCGDFKWFTKPIPHLHQLVMQAKRCMLPQSLSLVFAEFKEDTA